MFFNATEVMRYLANPNDLYTAHTLREQLTRAAGEAAGELPFTKSTAKKGLDTIFQAIKERRCEVNDVYITKFVRPWTVIPKYANFAVPENDFGVGIEIEMGFHSVSAARKVAAHVSRWKHIALDYEGPAEPIEVTFPPVLYSALNKCRAFDYLDFLKKREELVYKHDPGSSTGTHINVSFLGIEDKLRGWIKVDRINSVLYDLPEKDKDKYFGRMPYGYGYDCCSYVEWKLFNSQLSSERLLQYVDIAVELTRLLQDDNIAGYSNNSMKEKVMFALEEGYNKSTKNTQLSSEEQVAQEAVVQAA